MYKYLIIFAALIALGGCDSRLAEQAPGSASQPAKSEGAVQLPDKAYRPPIPDPTYASGEGPVVFVDEAHFNFHTLEGRFWPFGELLRRDGYSVRPLRGKLERATLDECDILVISNALPSDADWGTYSYPTPSAFTPEEIAATRAWVESGGSLLLIADHMPLAGAAADLARAFGVNFMDGYAMQRFDAISEDPYSVLRRPLIFRASDLTLRSHPIAQGRNERETVTSVRTFTGQAFQAPDTAEPLLVLPEDFIALMPVKPWQFSPETKRIPVGGWLQGAAMRVGSGRAAFFGEAATFTAQRVGDATMGMNAPDAEQNFQFALNLMRWLSGASDAAE